MDRNQITTPDELHNFIEERRKVRGKVTLLSIAQSEPFSVGSLILPSRFAIRCLHNKAPVRAIGCSTMNRIPRTYKARFMISIFQVESQLTIIGRGLGLVDQMAMLIHTEATHHTRSILATITINPNRFVANMTAKPIH